MNQGFFLLIGTLFLLQTAFTIPYTEKHQKGEAHLIVVKNHKLIFDVIPKNQINTSVLSIRLLQEPKLGDVLLDGLDSLTYVPQPDICEVTDQFEYLIKTEEGEQRVFIQVEILCESLTIVSGFTPNGDGISDTFTILGIENFPNNSLSIFNKWGEEVFSEKNYQNTWTGMLDDGYKITSNDTVYYYVFNNGEGKVYSGYLKIGENE